MALLLGLWVLIIFGLKISGAHYNPAISLAFMFRKDVGRFPRPLGIAYIIFQIIGGFLGALLAWFFTSSKFGGVVILNNGATFIAQGIITEILGTYLVAFFYLMQTDPKTTFSKEKAITCFIIASSYIAARSMMASSHITLSGACLNPAIGIGTSLTQLMATGIDGF